MSSPLRLLLAGAASGNSGALVGSTLQSLVTPTEMLADKYYPLDGSILNTVDQPKLAAGIGLRGYTSDVYEGMYYDFTDTTYNDHKCIGYDGDDVAVVAINYSSSAYIKAVRLSTGSQIVSANYVGSASPTCIRYINDYWYIGLNNGIVVRYNNTFSSSITLNGGAFSGSTYLNVHDIIEVNGYIYVATGEKILRASSTSTLTSSASWSTVYTYSFGYVNPVANETQRSNFFYDSVSGNILFCPISATGAVSTDGGSTWAVSPNLGSNRSAIVRWGTSLYTFIRDTPTTATTNAQGSVMESTNGGVSWFPSSMSLYITPSKMQPYVKNGYLHYVYRTAAGTYKFRIIKNRRFGLQTPVANQMNPNIIDVVTITKSDNYIGFESPSSDLGAKFILQAFGSAAYTVAGSLYFYASHDYLTQFKLPAIATDPPSYVKGQ